MNALIILLISGICLTSPIFSRAEEELNPCEEKPNGYNLPIPGTCSDFYICLNKRSIKQTCGTMYFNPKTHTCDLPQRVDCKRTFVMPQPETEPKPQQTEVHMCDGRENGGLVASTENCKDYHVCVGKMAIPRTCGWMHFNAVTGKCVEPRYSDCDQMKKMPKNRPVVKYEETGRAIHVPVLVMYQS